MTKINVLPKEVFNLISAGEVVERPASVVKELFENAIDSGAMEIIVSIENGGIDEIHVQDDGCGIEKDDLKKAFLPHATSKIAIAKDLENIETLGFRGEALASIAAVSKVRITSKTQDGDPWQITCQGGDMSEIHPAQGIDGTSVTVTEIFYNAVPRLAFLKSPKGEEREVTALVERMILSNPFVAVKYIVDGKLILQSYGEGMKDAILAVYGPNTLDNCYEINTSKNGIHIRGYISSTNFYKSNRSYQTIVLNGRYILDKTISAAMQNAYGEYLMKKQFPFFVLFIDVPGNVVDVNVHPRKEEVRFANNQIIYASIYTVVTDVLDGLRRAPEIVKSAPFLDLPEQKPIQTSSSGAIYDPKIVKSIPEYVDDGKPVERPEIPRKTPIYELVDFTNGKPYDEHEFQEALDAPPSVSGHPGYFSKEPVETHSPDESYVPKTTEKITGWQAYLAPDPEYAGKGKNDPRYDMEYPEVKFGKKKKAVNKEKLEVFVDFTDETVRNKKDEELDDIFRQNKEFIQKLEIETPYGQEDMGLDIPVVHVGQVMNTYLIEEYGDELIIIDQHAAHERLKFDELCRLAKERKVETQLLLVPFRFTINVSEADAIFDRLDYFEELGFELELTEDNEYIVYAVPLMLSNINLEAFFRDVLNDTKFWSESIPTVLREMLAQKACKSAIKAGYVMTNDEVQSLVFQLKKNWGLKCPHGRPIAVKISRTEIEKWFKRIV